MFCLYYLNWIFLKLISVKFRNGWLSYGNKFEQCCRGRNKKVQSNVRLMCPNAGIDVFFQFFAKRNRCILISWYAFISFNYFYPSQLEYWLWNIKSLYESVTLFEKLQFVKFALMAK